MHTELSPPIVAVTPEGIRALVERAEERMELVLVEQPEPAPEALVTVSWRGQG